MFDIDNVYYCEPGLLYIHYLIRSILGPGAYSSMMTWDLDVWRTIWTNIPCILVNAEYLELASAFSFLLHLVIFECLDYATPSASGGSSIMLVLTLTLRKLH